MSHRPLLGRSLSVRDIEGSPGVRGRNSDNQADEEQLGCKPVASLRGGIEVSYCRWKQNCVSMPPQAALTTMALTMDRFFLIRYASAEVVGVYHIGALPLTLGMMLGSLVDQYVGPKLLFRYGQGESLRFVFNRSLKASLVLVFFMVLAFPLVPVLAELVIDVFLPDYRASVPLVPIFYLGAIFICVHVHVPINAANRQVLQFYASLCVFAVSLIGYATLARYQAGVVWYAHVNVGGRMLSAILVTGISWQLVKKSNQSRGAVLR